MVGCEKVIVKGQTLFDVRTDSERADGNQLFMECIPASSIDIVINRIDKYLVRAD